MSPNSSPEVRLAVIETKQAGADDWRAQADITLSKIADALQKLTRLDIQGEALAKQVLDMRHEQREMLSALALRVQALENEMPLLLQSRAGVTEVAKKVLGYALTVLFAVVAAYLGFKGG